MNFFCFFSFRSCNEYLKRRITSFYSSTVIKLITVENSAPMLRVDKKILWEITVGGGYVIKITTTAFDRVFFDRERQGIRKYYLSKLTIIVVYDVRGVFLQSHPYLTRSIKTDFIKFSSAFRITRWNIPWSRSPCFVHDTRVYQFSAS